MCACVCGRLRAAAYARAQPAQTRAAAYIRARHARACARPASHRGGPGQPGGARLLADSEKGEDGEPRGHARSAGCARVTCVRRRVCVRVRKWAGGREREREREREIEREIEREREKEGPLSLSPPSTAPDGPPRPALPAQPVASRGAQPGETHRIQEGCSRRRSQNGNGSSAAIHLKMSQRLEIAEFRLKH